MSCTYTFDTSAKSTWDRQRAFIDECNDYIRLYKDRICTTTRNFHQTSSSPPRQVIDNIKLRHDIVKSKTNNLSNDKKPVNTNIIRNDLNAVVKNTSKTSPVNSNPIQTNDDDMDEDYKNFIKESILFRLEQRNNKRTKWNYQYVIQDDKIKQKEDAEMFYGKENAKDILGLEADLQRAYNYYCDRYNPKMIEICYKEL